MPEWFLLKMQAYSLQIHLKRLQQYCFPVDFLKFTGAAFLQKTSIDCSASPDICFKLTVKTLQRFQWHFCDFSIANFDLCMDVFPSQQLHVQSNNRNTRKRREICSKLTVNNLLLTLNIFHTLVSCFYC